MTIVPAVIFYCIVVLASGVWLFWRGRVDSRQRVVVKTGSRTGRSALADYEITQR